MSRQWQVTHTELFCSFVIKRLLAVDAKAAVALGTPDQEAECLSEIQALDDFVSIMVALAEPRPGSESISPKSKFKTSTGVDGRAEYLQKGPGFVGIYRLFGKDDKDIYEGMKCESR